MKRPDWSEVIQRAVIWKGSAKNPRAIQFLEPDRDRFRERNGARRAPDVAQATKVDRQRVAFQMRPAPKDVIHGDS